MKKIILLGLILVSFNVFGQTPKSIKLTKGQIISGKISSSVDMNFGMGTMKTDNNTNISIKVIDEDATSYTFTYTLTKIKMSIDGMGQSMTYDSENPDAKSEALGEKVSEKLNVPETFILNKLTGVVKPVNEKSEEKKDDEGMFGLPNTQNQGAMDAFLIIPANVKMGGSWTDSTTLNDISTTKNFKWVATDKDIATIKVSGSVSGSTEQEIQGSKTPISLNFTFDETRSVNIKTGQVIKVVNDGKMETTLESMGMTMNSTLNALTEFSN